MTDAAVVLYVHSPSNREFVMNDLGNYFRKQTAILEERLVIGGKVADFKIIHFRVIDTLIYLIR